MNRSQNESHNLSRPTPRTYLTVFITLLILLGATYVLAHIDLGPWNTPLALLIAASKALLVVLYFMEIRYSAGLHRIMAVVGIFWLAILINLVLTDYLTRHFLLLPGNWPQTIAN